VADGQHSLDVWDFRAVDRAVSAPEELLANMVYGVTAGTVELPGLRALITADVGPGSAHPLSVSGGTDWTVEHVSCSGRAGVNAL
jgi:hypothetical protein